MRCVDCGCVCIGYMAPNILNSRRCHNCFPKYQAQIELEEKKKKEEEAKLEEKKLEEKKLEEEKVNRFEILDF